MRTVRARPPPCVAPATGIALDLRNSSAAGPSVTRMALSRRRVLFAVAAAAAGLGGCGGRSGATARRWHDGRLYIATGNTTGVFYQIAGGYADIVTEHVPGYQA